MVGHTSITYVLFEHKNQNSKLKGESNNKTLKEISKNEMTYLIQKNVIRQSKGTYGDSLVVTGKFGKGRGKQRYCIDPVYNYLLRLKLTDRLKIFFSPEQLKEILRLDVSEQIEVVKELEKNNVDLIKVKENQRYMFSSNNSECVS